MKPLLSYISEKLIIDNTVKISKTKKMDELYDTIDEYCKKRLSLKQDKYSIYFEDSSGKRLSMNEYEKLARICLVSKDFRDIDTVANELAYKVNKVKKIKKTEVFVTSIYFYFDNE